MYKFGSTQYNNALVSLEISFNKYLKNSYERYSKIKTLLYRDRPVELKNHYVSSDFKIGKKIFNGNDVLCEFIRSKKSIVIGTAGSGKSVLLRKLFLDLVENKFGLAPVLIELRLIESYENDLSVHKYIHKTISELDEGLTLDQLHYALKHGKIILLLDGFDEIGFYNRERYEREILEISRKYPKTPIIVSSRPDDCLSSWEEFYVYNALPLNKEQAADLISRIDYDTTVKNKFIEELISGLYDRHRDFLSNPLLLTMMLLTYEQLAEIPEKIHIFYEQAFDTLFHKHDALKSLYKRKSYTGLPIDDFKRLFSAFCILTYSDRKISFSYHDLLRYIDQAIELESVHVDASKFFNDLIKSVCILQKDGNVYTFTHRSFQEYFSAYFISRSQLIDFKGILDSIVLGYFSDSVINIIFEINREKIEMHWILPNLKDLVPLCNTAINNSDTLAFLKIFYEALSIHESGIAFQLSERKSFGYFSSLLHRTYPKIAKIYFVPQNLSEDERKEKAKKEIAVLEQHCKLDNERSISLSKIPADSIWFEEAGLTAYCHRRAQFLQSLLEDLNKKYIDKENNLKSLLKKRTQSEVAS